MKETFEPYGSVVLRESTKKIKDFIVNLVKRNFLLLGGEMSDDSNYVLDVSGLNVNITIEVDNSYLGIHETCFETKTIDEIIVDNNDNLIFKIYDDDREYNGDKVDFLDLVGIANMLEYHAYLLTNSLA